MQERKKVGKVQGAALKWKKNQRGTGCVKDLNITGITPEFNEYKREMRCKNKINKKFNNWQKTIPQISPILLHYLLCRRCFSIHLSRCANFPYSSWTVNLELWYNLHFPAHPCLFSFKDPPLRGEKNPLNLKIVSLNLCTRNLCSSSKKFSKTF